MEATTPELIVRVSELRVGEPAAQPSRRWRAIWVVLVLSLAGSCVEVATPPSPARCERWLASMPMGVRSLLETAATVADAYHAIADTSIVDLQNKAMSEEIGARVTRARDSWRRTESHGLNWRAADASFLWNADFTPLGYAIQCTADEDHVSIRSNRGRPICTLHAIGTVEWHSPFDAIVYGDRIDSIQSLIARIKR
jgi:hypothetical protein